MRYSIYEKYIKRVIDFFFAVLALPFVIIIILIVSPFIICCDGWPVFYNAKRMGRYGNTFKMYINLHKVYLHVFASNARAIRCYEKAGYQVKGRLTEHHFSNGKYEDVLIMEKIRT